MLVSALAIRQNMLPMALVMYMRYHGSHQSGISDLKTPTRAVSGVGGDEGDFLPFHDIDRGVHLKRSGNS